ncbi:MAG: hypothetical protein HQK66_06770 [Desulfamplus sp.]|nr:hypothetical protein [Desulfamplus sp.]
MKQPEIPGGAGKREESSWKDAQEDHEMPIRCAFCRHPVTDESQTISVEGSHNHLFANPHGMVFDICCFKECEGAIPVSEPSSEFSWFPGYLWRVAACSFCYKHLGWLFSGESSSFYGMIQSHLIFTS